MGVVRIAVISDIHGYSIALDRVLQDIDRCGVDQIIVAGDLVESGPDPAGVLERITSRNLIAVHGNRDSKTAIWTEDQIGVEGKEFLAHLPFSYRVSPENAVHPEQDLLIVHANPFDFDHAIDPEADEAALDTLIGDTRAAVVAFGHIHISYIRRYGSMILADVSAVGNPKDGDLRSRWGLFTWESLSQSWTAEIRYVDYPIDETEAQIKASGMPKPQKRIRKLMKASY